MSKSEITEIKFQGTTLYIIDYYNTSPRIINVSILPAQRNFLGKTLYTNLKTEVHYDHLMQIVPDWYTNKIELRIMTDS